MSSPPPKEIASLPTAEAESDYESAGWDLNRDMKFWSSVLMYLFGNSLETDTTTLGSSILDYVFENGRRYTRRGSLEKYALPNDEQDRLDLSHHVYLMLLHGNLHTAPLEDKEDGIHRVLDAGTGTGIWALDFGENHPGAQVTGVDLSLIQPSWTLPNVKFEVDDLEKEWTWPKDYFDFVYGRTLQAGVRAYKKFLKQSFDHISPGGYVEIAEQVELECHDDTIKGSAIEKYYRLLMSGMKKAGIPIFNATELEQQVKEAGFVDVVVQRHVIPWGPWPKDKHLRQVGRYWTGNLQTGLEAYGMAVMTNLHGMAPEEVKELLQECSGRNDLSQSTCSCPVVHDFRT